MGKGQEVASAYMGIKEGEPHPTTEINVGVGRDRRSEGESDAERVRRYSWQLPQKKCRMKIISWRGATPSLV